MLRSHGQIGHTLPLDKLMKGDTRHMTAHRQVQAHPHTGTHTSGKHAQAYTETGVPYINTPDEQAWGGKATP